MLLPKVMSGKSMGGGSGGVRNSGGLPPSTNGVSVGTGAGDRKVIRLQARDVADIVARCLLPRYTVHRRLYSCCYLT